ncbi:hypothetical protein [Desulfobacula phenolica]|uniref:hypothetical protein n=1 Tax=Desulfobacula phenolica TaxID=90732 RepID=UPI000B889F5D|nr:hypothetical protein [Desulfobacula phenolica]
MQFRPWTVELPETDCLTASAAFGYKTENKTYSFRHIYRLFETTLKDFGFNAACRSDLVKGITEELIKRKETV